MQFLESYCKNRRRSRKSWPTFHAKWSTSRETTRSIILNFLLLMRTSVIGVTTSSNRITLWKYSPIIATYVRWRVCISSRGGKFNGLLTCLYLFLVGLLQGEPQPYRQSFTSTKLPERCWIRSLNDWQYLSYSEDAVPYCCFGNLLTYINHKGEGQTNSSCWDFWFTVFKSKGTSKRSCLKRKHIWRRI